ncbi:glutamine amidotransferase-related protein [Nocardia cyriacigeorgica]|uniref:glutamine amidotransferase-related protein n=1 Tax=Nocardia cyriacigeorgica TaxID=135487 RepID=UPI003CC7DF35
MVGILFCPGPCTPDRAGASFELVHAAARQRTPLLGVCLGHQSIGAALGAPRAPGPALAPPQTRPL